MLPSYSMTFHSLDAITPSSHPFNDAQTISSSPFPRRILLLVLAFLRCRPRSMTFDSRNDIRSDHITSLRRRIFTWFQPSVGFDFISHTIDHHMEYARRVADSQTITSEATRGTGRMICLLSLYQS